MTDMEIPPEALRDAAQRLYDAQWVGDPTEGQFVDERFDYCEDTARIALAAALPHLQADTKAMCETARELGRRIGRQEAAEEIAAVFELEQHEGDREMVLITLGNAAKIARDIGKGDLNG